MTAGKCACAGGTPRSSCHGPPRRGLHALSCTFIDSLVTRQKKSTAVVILAGQPLGEVQVDREAPRDVILISDSRPSRSRSSTARA